MSEREYPEGYAERIQFFREGVRTGTDAYRKGMIAHFAQSAAIGAIDPTKEEDFRPYKGIVPYTPYRWTDWTHEDYQDLLKYTGIRPKMTWWGSYLRWNPAKLALSWKILRQAKLPGLGNTEYYEYDILPPPGYRISPLSVTVRGPNQPDPFYRISKGKYTHNGQTLNLQNEQKKSWRGQSELEVLHQMLQWYENSVLTPMQLMQIGLARPNGAIMKYAQANPSRRSKTRSKTTHVIHVLMHGYDTERDDIITDSLAPRDRKLLDGSDYGFEKQDRTLYFHASRKTTADRLVKTLRAILKKNKIKGKVSTHELKVESF